MVQGLAHSQGAFLFQIAVKLIKTANHTNTPKTTEAEDELLTQDPLFKQHKHKEENYREEITGKANRRRRSWGAAALG